MNSIFILWQLLYSPCKSLASGFIWYLSQHHWYSALAWLLYYSFVEKCDNYSDVRKDKAANQPQIIGKRVAKDFLSCAAIVKCLLYYSIISKINFKIGDGRWPIYFYGVTVLVLDLVHGSKLVQLRHFVWMFVMIEWHRENAVRVSFM